MNKFDEAIELLDKSTNSRVEQKGLTSYGMYYAPEVVELLHDLKEEYAPTVEMTKRQKDNLISTKQDGYSFVETIADIDSGVLIREFDSYWNPLTVDELMQAWLHPETIRVVDE